jgi:hypothetical protein
MTGKFLSDTEQASMEISGDIAVWYSPSVERSNELKTKVQMLAAWIRKVASKII